MSATDSTDTDKQLVARVQKGDKRAFDLLVIKYQHKVGTIVGRYIQDREEVKDIVQEAFIKAYRALGTFRGDSQFYTWLYRIAVNTAKNFLVSRSRRPPASDVEIDDAEYFSGGDKLRDVASPESLVFKDELEKVVNLVINNLPQDLRTALTLREFDNLSYDAIAEIMDCPVGTVRSRIFRAREVVDQKVKGLLAGEC